VSTTTRVGRYFALGNTCPVAFSSYQLSTAVTAVRTVACTPFQVHSNFRTCFTNFCSVCFDRCHLLPSPSLSNLRSCCVAVCVCVCVSVSTELRRHAALVSAAKVMRCIQCSVVIFLLLQLLLLSVLSQQSLRHKPGPSEENFWQLLVHDVLQTRCHSCHPTNSVKALKV